MAIVDQLVFSKKQLKEFAQLLFNARKAAKMSQMEVARQAFGYEVSHCKVSRIERAVMPKVDAVAIHNIAEVFGIPMAALAAIAPKFPAQVAVMKTATAKGLWDHPAITVA